MNGSRCISSAHGNILLAAKSFGLSLINFSESNISCRIHLIHQNTEGSVSSNVHGPHGRCYTMSSNVSCNVTIDFVAT